MKMHAPPETYLKYGQLHQGMERNERIQLEALQRDLKKQLVRTDTLLRTASPPKRRTPTEAQQRAGKICAEIKASGGTVTRDQLKALAKRHGFPFNNIGALYVAGYLKTSTGKKVSLGQRGRELSKKRKKK